MLSTRLSILAFLAAACLWTSAVGQLYDVACPGQNSKLQCPQGDQIKVLTVDYGDISNADCNARHQPAKLTKSRCMHAGMLPWTNCDKRTHCRLPKPNPQMLICDYVENSTFIQTTYICQDRVPGVKSVVACEGDKANISCGNGRLKIVGSGFGRFDRDTCTDTPSNMTFCTSYSTEAVVRKLCDSEQECEIEATEDKLGKPTICDDLPKFLIVDYICQ
ncbi:protein eva-1 homolog C-like [Chaetodon auriga]|uniref:protein eva-1 homolog C-like n=1 Tax=Chaetodon auriga TaxID=39042 RepID=UPI0040331211